MMRKKKGRGGGEVSYAGAKGRSKRLSPLWRTSPSPPISLHLLTWSSARAVVGDPTRSARAATASSVMAAMMEFFFLW
jgi:hypothetical protein